MTLPQLHLRDLFWLVLVVAMGCGWWVERQKLLTEAHEGKTFRWRAESLEDIMTLFDYKVEWDTVDGEDLVVRHPDGSISGRGDKP